MAQLHPDMPIHQRIDLIAAALARVLDRGPEMSVGPSGPAGTDLGVWLIANPWSDERIAVEIDDLARELEVLL